MAIDSQYVNQPNTKCELKHLYGDKVHILSNTMAQTLLTRLSSPKTIQPELNNLLERLYGVLLESVVNGIFPKESVTSDTRMKEFLSEGVLTCDVVKYDQAVISVDLARAGIYPSHHCFHVLNQFLNPSLLRQDHFYMQRKVDENDQVIGVDVTGSKIGGGQEDAIVLFPDPMGATGGSLSHAISHYKNNIEGKAYKYIAMHLIVTPEYIERMSKDHPDVEIFALRLDRGLSTDEALQSIPGTHPKSERGLTDNQYIVPGAGGVGEILNNSFV
jgi:uracil phosphoribosyltransferase